MKGERESGKRRRRGREKEEKVDLDLEDGENGNTSDNEPHHIIFPLIIYHILN